LREWELDAKRRDLAEVQAGAQALIDTLQAIEDELIREQAIAATSLEASMSYNAFANSVIRRREDLNTAILEKEEDVDAANAEMTAAFQEMRKAEIVRDAFG
jgi:hypothetical protein